MIIDPAAVTPTDIYKVLVGTIVPRPIGFVSSISASGSNNLAPFSFFNGVSADPPVVVFSPLRNSESKKKDTRNNIEATGEFVVNIVSQAIADQMNITSAQCAPEVDEFELSGLTPVPSIHVKSMRVKESPVNMECRLMQIVDFGDKPLAGCLIIGQILCIHVADELIDNYRIDPDKLNAVGRMAGNTYVRTTDRFELIRPK
jgi:flavin reductase (DIM6/NTAB) family NADH-FMN oxidoreductase RutF